MLAAYRRSLDKVCSGAGNAAMEALGEWLEANPDATVEECREAAISIANTVLESYGDVSSSLACNLFDSVMEAEGIPVPAAQMYVGVREGAVEGTVRRVVGGVDGSQASLDAFTQAVGQLVERETRLAANTTVEENVERVAKTKAGRDVRYARVPTRAVPCEWCAMLASRGFVYRSAERAEAASHHHCTCTIVPGVQGVTEVAGYDPGHYYDVWQHPERYEGADTQLLRQTEAKVAIPSSYDGNFDDFRPLELDEDEVESLRGLNRLARENGYEYAQVLFEDHAGEPFTSGYPDRVRIKLDEIPGNDLRLFHCHTNDTPLSREDFSYLCSERVLEVGNVAINGDAFVVRVGNGWRPSPEQFERDTIQIANEVNLDMPRNPDFDSWSIPERNYMAIREQAYRIAAHYEWELMGGSIDEL